MFNISDAPVCSSDADQLIGVTADESISINCRVRYLLNEHEFGLELLYFSPKF